MSTLVDTPKTASYADGMVVVEMDSGVELRFPIERNPRLENASEELLNNIEVSPYGLHWNELDEDLSIQGIHNGDYGQRG